MILRHFLKFCAAVSLVTAVSGTPWAQAPAAKARKPVAAKPAAVAPTTPDEAFLAAHAAFRTGDQARLVAAQPLLEGHLLEQYAEFWRIKQRQEEATPVEIRAFLAKYPGGYLAERLRTDWLRDLGRKGNWQVFDLEVAPLTQEDLEIRCYTLLSRLMRQDASAYDEAKDFWLEPRDLPEGCGKLADLLVERGKITLRQVWQRARTLLGAGQISAAKATFAYLPANEKIDEALFNLAANAPQKLLANIPADLNHRGTREMAMFAVIRLARNEPRPAADAMRKTLNERLQPADRRHVWGYLGFEAARRLYPDAMEWFAQAGDAELTDDQLAWKVRAALRAGDWRSVRDSIDRMSVAAHTRDNAWTYWYGRALAALGNAQGAKAYFLKISAQPNFYGVLAAEALGSSMYLPPATHVASDADIAQLRRVPGVARMMALYRFNLRLEGIREWVHTVRDLDDRHLIAAAELARRSEYYDRAINTADRTDRIHNFQLRYLAPFRESFKEHVQATELEEAWVLGVVRQESRFIVEARSHAGARGLMQLMPATARWVARNSGMKDFSPARVHEIDINIALGTRYLKLVLDDLGHPVLATSAYNAGPGRARRWRDAKPLEGAIYVESIPFSETRDYVKKVMSNTMYYTAVLEGKAVPLRERLGTIPARSASERFNEDLP